MTRLCKLNSGDKPTIKPKTTAIEICRGELSEFNALNNLASRVSIFLLKMQCEKVTIN